MDGPSLSEKDINRIIPASKVLLQTQCFPLMGKRNNYDLVDKYEKMKNVIEKMFMASRA